jgi:hypothetical protein
LRQLPEVGQVLTRKVSPDDQDAKLRSSRTQTFCNALNLTGSTPADSAETKTAIESGPAVRRRA